MRNTVPANVEDVGRPPLTPTGMVSEITQLIRDFNGRDAGDDITPTDVAERIVAVVLAHDGPDLA